MPLQPDSFTFAGVDMLATYGIRMIASDVLQPKLRPRKLTVPERDGAYDYGAQYYDERTLRLACDSRISLSRQQLRELAGLLSDKGRIVLWDEPDKYYLGRLYNPSQLKYIGSIGHEFTLDFTCDPFAFGKTVDAVLVPAIKYAGTAATPTRLQITNGGSFPVTRIQIRIRERRN